MQSEMSTQDSAIRTRSIDPSNTTTTPGTTDHAKLRLLERAGYTQLTLTEAWLEGYYVGFDDRNGKARLHPPTDTILIEKSGVITTVFKAAYIAYNADHLLECDACELKYEPETDDQRCPWCSDGQLEVTQ